LVLSSLYFDGEVPTTLTYGTVQAVGDTGLATAVPLQIGSRVGDQPVVGTSPDYFLFRELAVASGRLLALSGEALLGAAAARILDVSPGESVVTASQTIFDVTGNYPLKLRVVGVLKATGTPDDDAVFVDVRTAWIIDGIGHGHEDLSRPDAAAAVLERDGGNIVANAAVVQYREITPANLSDFHFHGDIKDFPLAAIIAVPADEKSGVLLEGRYQVPSGSVQAIRPVVVMDELLATVFTVRQYVLAAVGLVGVATFATIALVFLLSARLRRGEIDTMMRIGAAPGRVAAMLGAEIALVLATSVVLAGALTWFATLWGESLLRWMLST
jgi:putative ABC transport system permease protein